MILEDIAPRYSARSLCLQHCAAGTNPPPPQRLLEGKLREGVLGSKDVETGR